MGFMQFIKSLDDLLYEVMTWLVFYPVTLWRTVRHPGRMMTYADTELGDSADQQCQDTLSPPLFLLLTLLLSHLIELAVVGQSEMVGSKRGLAALISDDTTLLIFRLLIFSMVPMILAVLTLRLRGQSLHDALLGAIGPSATLLVADSPVPPQSTGRRSTVLDER